MIARVRHLAEQLVRELREDSPPVVPVRMTWLRSRPGREAVGSCVLIYDKKDRPVRFAISVELTSRWSYVRDTLLHEWAHAMVWAQDGTAEDHGPEWAMAFSRLYQEYVDP